PLVISRAPTSRTAVSCLVLAWCPAPLDTLSLHDALPIFHNEYGYENIIIGGISMGNFGAWRMIQKSTPGIEYVKGIIAICGSGSDRKSTRLNSSHVKISYAVFCLKKKRIRSSVPAESCCA